MSAYLMEFLPYEEIQLNIVNMVRLCLQNNILEDKEIHKLWSRARRRNPFYVGFVHTDPSQIPLELSSHPKYEEIYQNLKPLINNDNKFAIRFCQLLSKDGQKWLETVKLSLKKPVDQDVVISLFTAISNYFNLAICNPRGQQDIDTVLTQSEYFCDRSNAGVLENLELQELLATIEPEYIPILKSMLVLAQLGEHTLIPIFSGNDSVGTAMRKRLLPLTTPLLEKVDILMQ